MKVFIKNFNFYPPKFKFSNKKLYLFAVMFLSIKKNPLVKFTSVHSSRSQRCIIHFFPKKKVKKKLLF